MKKILVGLIMLIGYIGLQALLAGADAGEQDSIESGRGILFARFFIDPQQYPNQPHPDLSKLDSGGGLPYREIDFEVPDGSGEQESETQEIKSDKKKEEKKDEKKEEKKEVKPDDKGKGKEKTAIKEEKKAAPDTGGKRRGVFNFNLMFGGSVAYYRMNRIISTVGGPILSIPFPSLSIPYVQNEEKGKYLGFSPGISLTFVFNVAKYFALGFGSDASYFYPFMLSSRTTFNRPASNYPAPNPSFYLEVPVYGLMRFYFSEKFRTAYLSLGGGVDFFLLGKPFARSIIARGGIGFNLDNGFTMEFAYQYNTDLAQGSSMTNIRDMHRGMIWMGYGFNTGGK